MKGRARRWKPSALRRRSRSLDRLLRVLLFAIGPVGGCRRPPGALLCKRFSARLATPTYHGDRQRTGWNRDETDLTPATVASPAFGPLWDSLPLDPVTIDGTAYAPHLYASLLEADDLPIGGPYAGLRSSVLFAASTNGFVYAVSGFDAGCGARPIPAGTILWSASLGTPTPIASLDGGVPLGVLGTPFLDLAALPPRLYVAAIDATIGWQVWALDATSGAVLPGWPVVVDDATVAPVNQNGPAPFERYDVVSQRGALALSPDGRMLYVPFGAYSDHGAGWLVAIDTGTVKVVSSFSGAPSAAPTANGGIWSAGGPAIDAQGSVFVTTGNSPPPASCCPPTGTGAPAVFGDSFLAFTEGLTLAGRYTPWNYCQLDCADSDVGGSSPLLFDLDPTSSATPHLAVFGGKQGVVYLVDRDHLTGRLDARPACSSDPTSDGSLLPPAPGPPLATRAPLDVFGPYGENCTNFDYARMRTTAAYFQDASGATELFVAGTTRPADCVARCMDTCPSDCGSAVPPSLVRLRVVTSPTAPAYLAMDGAERTLAFANPGSPIVTSDGEADAIVWVVDENAARSTPLVGPGTAAPVLYAIDARTLTLLYESAAGDLAEGGKYVTPVVAHGVVFVGTDRVQAFGLRSATIGQ